MSIRTWLFDLTGAIAVICMVGCIYLLVREYEGGFGELQLDVTQEDLEAGFREGYEYHAIYSGSQKVGTLRTERRYDGDGYHMRSELDIEIRMGLMAQRTRTVLDAFLNDEFRLDRFAVTTTGGLLELDLEGHWNGDAVVVTGLPGESSAREFEMPEPPFILHSLRPVLMRSNLSAGDRATFNYYDPVSQEPITADVTYIAKEDIELMGTVVEAYHFREIAMGQQTNVWVNALGEVLIEELPMGFRAIREPEDEARYGLREGTDSQLLERAKGIDFNGVTSPSLGRSRWTTATFQIVDPRRVLKDADVTPVIGGDESVYRRTVGSELPTRSVMDSLDREVLAEWLGESLQIETTGPDVLAAIRAAQPTATGDRIRMDERARAYCTWLKNEIELTSAGERELETAAGVLRARSGSVVGKARALVAMLRADGIPSRLVSGAVAIGSDPTRLVSHVWVEAWLGDWSGLDPTLNMIPTDAGYLRVAVGADAASPFIAGSMSTMSVENVEGTR